jgi:hypothetical protein
MCYIQMRRVSRHPCAPTTAIGTLHDVHAFSIRGIQGNYFVRLRLLLVLLSRGDLAPLATRLVPFCCTVAPLPCAPEVPAALAAPAAIPPAASPVLTPVDAAALVGGCWLGVITGPPANTGGCPAPAPAAGAGRCAGCPVAAAAAAAAARAFSSATRLFAAATTACAARGPEMEDGTAARPCATLRETAVTALLTPGVVAAAVGGRMVVAVEEPGHCRAAPWVWLRAAEEWGGMREAEDWGGAGGAERFVA